MEQKSPYICTRFTEVGQQSEGEKRGRNGQKKRNKKKIAWELEEKKKRLLLHPLYRGRAAEQGGNQGRKRAGGII